MINVRSKIATDILNYFFLNPEESLYINEISRILGADKRNLVKKLKELEKHGILISFPRGNQKFFKLNRKYPLLAEYKKIISKTSGMESKIKRIVDLAKGVESAYIFGSYASGKMDEASDIDVLVVGSHKGIDIVKNMHELQRQTGREINVINIGGDELNRKLKDKDPFYSGILKGRHIKIA